MSVDSKAAINMCLLSKKREIELIRIFLQLLKAYNGHIRKDEKTVQSVFKVISSFPNVYGK